MRRVFTLLLLVSVVLASIFTFATAAQAQTYTWTGNSTADWADPGSWLGGVPGSTNIALFNGSSPYTNQPSINEADSLGGLWDTGSATVAIGGTSYTLTIYGTTINGNANTGIEMDSGAGNLTISAPLVLQNPQTWLNNAASASGVMTVSGSVNNSGNLLTLAGSGTSLISGVVSGGGGLTMSGLGLMTLNAADTYTGATTVNAGTLAIGSLGSLNTSSALAGGGGTFLFGGGASQTVNGLTVNAGASAIQNLDGTGSIILALGGITRNVGGVANFPTASSSAFVVTTTAPNSSNAILGGWATSGGSTWAVTGSSGTNPITGLTTYVASVGGTTAPGATADVDFQASNSAAWATQTINSLRFNSDAGATLNITGGSLGILSGGILVTPNETGNPTITGGTLEGAAGSTGDLVVIQNSTSQSLTISSKIANNGASATGLTSGGPGLTILTATNTYTGPTTVAGGGTLQVGRGSTGALGTGGSYSGAVSIFNGSALVFDTTAAQTLSGPITGPGVVVQSGSGNLTLSASNGYSGGTTLSSGLLTVSNSNALGTGALTIGGGTLAAAGAYTLANPLAVNNATALLGGNNPFIFTGGTFTGANTLNLSKNLTISGGTVSLANGSNTTFIGGSVQNISGGSLNLNGGAATITYNETNYPILAGAFVGSAGTLVLAGSNTNLEVGPLTGNGALQINSTNGGVFQLNTTASYSGGTILTSGRLNLGSFSSVLGTGNLTLTGGTLKANGLSMPGGIIMSNGTSTIYNSTFTCTGGTFGGTNTLTLSQNLTISGGTVSLANGSNTTFIGTAAEVINGGDSLNLNGGAATITNNGSNYPTFSGAFVGSAGTLVLAGSNTNLTIGPLTGAGTMVYAPANTFKLSTSNGYTGGTIISSGLVNLNNANAFGTGPLTVNGGTLQLNGNSLTVAGLSGSGGTITATGGALTTNSATATTYAGVIIGAGGLTQNSSGGSLTLTGSNTYTGATNITAGTLAIGGTGSLGTGGNYAAAIANSGALVVNTSSPQTFSGKISGGGALYQIGSGGVTTLTASNGYTGGTTITAGTLIVANTAGSATGSGTVTLNGGTLASLAVSTGTISGTVVGGSAAHVIAPGGSGIGTLTIGGLNANNNTTLQFNINGASSSLLNLNGTLSETQAVPITLGASVGEVAGYYPIIKDASASSLSGSFSAPAAGNGFSYTLDYGSHTANYIDLDVAAAVAALTWSGTAGSATWDFSTTNWNTAAGVAAAYQDLAVLTFTGTSSNNSITISPSAGLSVVSPASLSFTGSPANPYIFSGAGIGGLAIVSISGSGNVTFTNSNTFTGGISISAGTLTLAGTGSLGAGNNYAGTILNSGALVVSNSTASSAQTLSGPISGPGVVVQQGSGNLTLSASNAYSGGTTLSSGWLTVGNANALGTGALTIGGGTLAANGSYTLPNQLSMSGATAAVGGSNTIATSGGASFANNNTLNLAAALTLSGGTVSLDSGSNQTFSGGSALTISGGSLNLNGGSDTLTFNNGAASSPISGAMSAGTLVLAGSNTAVSVGSLTGGGAVQVNSTNGGVFTFNGGASSYTGGTTLSSGSLVMGNANGLGGGNGSLTVNGGALDLAGYSPTIGVLSGGGGVITASSAGTLTTNNPSASTTFAGTISGLAGLTQSGAGGMLTLTGSSTYSSATNITAGTLQIGGGGVLGTGGNYAAAIANSGALAVNTSSNQTFSGVISGGGALLQGGNGITTLTNTNTYTGATSISAGTLQLGTGTSGQDGSIPGTSGVTNNAALVYNLNGNQTANYSINGPGGLTKLGGGMLTIAASQGYTGPTTVSAGTLQLQGTTQIATTGSIGVHFLGGTTYSATNGSGVLGVTNNWMNLSATTFTNQALTDSSGNPTTAQFSYVSSSGNNLSPCNTSPINLFNGGLNLQGAATYQLTFSGIPYTSYTLYTYVGAGPSWQSGANSTVSLGGTTYYVGEQTNPTGYIQVTSTSSTNYQNGDYEMFPGLTASSGTVTISKVTGSTYGWEGFEIVGAGTTPIPGGGVNVLSPSTTLTVARGATLDLGGGSQQVQWLSDASPGLGGNVINSNSAAALLAFSPSGGASTTFSGTIQGGIGLAMSGSGAQVLAGTNTYSGATQVSGGTLAAAVSGALPSTSNVTVTAGVLDVTAALQTVSSLTIGAAGTLNLNDLYPLTVSTTATFSGGTLNVSSTNSTPVTPDLLMTYSTSAGVGFGSVSFNGSALPGTDSLSYSGGSLEIIGPSTWKWNQSAGGSWQNNPGYWTPAGVPSNGTATFPELGATSTIQVTLDGPQTATGLVFSASEGYTLAPGSGGTLTLSNSATVAVLSGTHTISAPLQIAGGSLVVAESGNGVLNITGNISDDNGQRSLTLTGDGSGQLVLSGTNSYGGGTNVNAGAMYVTNSSALPPATNLAVGAGGTFIFDPNGPGDNVATSASHATIAVEAVPEPGTLALLIAGLAVGLGVWQRRKKMSKDFA